MRRAISHRTAGTWPAEKQTGSVSLAHDERHRRRVRLADDAGAPFLLDLAEATVMRDGDGLELEDGGYLAVLAKPEAVIDCVCRSAQHCAQLAWHIGNRHTPAEILDGPVIRIAADHVLEHMAEGLGAVIEHRVAPFNPESGAYAGGHSHDHAHGHAHGHGEGHGHAKGHGHHHDA